jgi:hypothetical protein
MQATHDDKIKDSFIGDLEAVQDKVEENKKKGYKVMTGVLPREGETITVQGPTGGCRFKVLKELNKMKGKYIIEFCRSEDS